MPFLWDDDAWEEYEYWQTQDRKTLRRINSLLKEIARAGNEGRPMGKAELLRHTSESLRSVRIDSKNRLTYKIDGDRVRVVSCRGHYRSN